MGDKTITAINLGYTGSAGFTYRLYRLEPRALRSKGASTNCGTHRVNGRYMIIKHSTSSKIYVLISIHDIWFYSTFVVITPVSSNEFLWISI